MNFESILSGIKDKIGGLFAPQKMISPLPEGYRPEHQEQYSLIRKYRPQYKGSDADISGLIDKYGDDSVMGEIRGEMGGKPMQRAPQPMQKSAPQVLGAQAVARPVTTEQIQRGWDEYGDGNAPAATMSAKFAEVANKYPVLQKYPGLLPAMAMKETSGGKASQNKNWFNWGVHDDNYQESDPGKVIEAVARALGSDDSNSSHYYEKFRETGDVRDMLDRYAPPGENDTDLYHKQLMDWMKMFAQ